VIAWLALAAWGQEVHRYSLLVGTNDGGGERVPLRYAHSDAQQLGDVLLDVGGVAPERQRTILDPDAAALAAAFAALEAELAADPARTEVVFYYSGHSDEEGLLLGEERFGYPELRAALERLPARVRVAILDSCASGALILSKGGRKVAPFLVDDSVAVDGFAYITSSSADEVSQEAERVGGSYFTYYLETGLRGAADRSDDGRVTLTEAYAFAYDETLARTERTQHGPQHPTYQIELSGTGDLVLTDLSLTESSLVLEEGVEGRALVRDDDGDLVAELDKPGGRRVEIALPAGEYTVTLVPQEDGRYAVAEVELYAGTDSFVHASSLDWREGESTLTRGAAPEAVVTGPPSRDRLAVRASVFDLVFESDDQLVASLRGRSETLAGVAIGGAGHEVRGHAKSLVGGFGYTSVGAIDGVQVAMGGNVARRGGSGLQLSMGANVASAEIAEEGFDGVQASLGLNLAEGGINGAQLATGINHAGDGFNGLQLTAAANVAGGFSEGAQVAAVNVAPDLDGVQLGVLNLARDVRGAQLGVVNVGGEVGLQLGVVNVAEDADAPLGLLSFVRDGRHDLLLYASESDPANLELRLGGRYVYNVLGGGGGGGKGYAAYGVGVHGPFLGDRAWMDVDGVLASYVDRRGGWIDGPPTGVGRGRVTVGAAPVPMLGVYAGATANVRIPVEELRLVEVTPEWLRPDTGTVVFWPGFFAGVSLRI
jgi:hypothetical protein